MTRAALVLLTVAPAMARAATWTVCTEGGCDHDTLTACVSTAAAGDECQVLGGVYHETADYQSNFSIGVRLTCPAQDCVIDGDGVRDHALIAYRDWEIDGFEIRNTTGDAFSGATARELAAVRDCWIHDLGGHAISRLNDDAVVEGNLVERVWGHAVTCGTRRDISILDNTVVSSGMGSGTHGIVCGTGSLVSGNVVDLRDTTLPFAGAAPYGIVATTVVGNTVVGGNVSVSASVASMDNTVWGWSSAAWGGVAPGPGDMTLDPGFSPLLPVDEVPAALDAPAAPSMVVLPGAGPALAWFDPDLDTLAYAVRDGVDSWAVEDVVAADPPDELSMDVREHLVDLAIDPLTGRPAMAWLEETANVTSLRFARFLGAGCGSDCGSANWQGCTDPPLLTFSGSGSLSLAVDPVDGTPVIALVARSGPSCGSEDDASVDLFRLEPGGWTVTTLDTGGCTHDLGMGIDVGVAPLSGDVEVVWTRAPDGDDAGVLRHAVVPLDGNTTVADLDLGDLQTHDGPFTHVALVHDALDDLTVMFTARDAALTYAYAEMHRAHGAWSAPVVVDAVGGGGVRPVDGLDLVLDDDGLPLGAWTRNAAPRLGWPTEPDLGFEHFDARRRTGAWLSLAAVGTDAVLSYQSESPNMDLHVVATADPGASPPGGGLTETCASTDPCMVAACDPDDGCVTTAQDCDDGDVCTDDVCLGGGGCDHTFNTAPCDDGDPQTTGDTCDMGTCRGTPPPLDLVVQEGVAVADAPGLLAPVNVLVEEGIGVADAPGLLSGMVVALAETLGVTDALDVRPPLTVQVLEALGVLDAPDVRPPLTVQVLERLGVADAPDLLPPLSLQVSEALGVADATNTLAGLRLDVSEALGLSDEVGTLEGLAIAIQEQVGVREDDTARVRNPICATGGFTPGSAWLFVLLWVRRRRQHADRQA